MKQLPLILAAALLLASGCTSQQKLAYLNNLPEAGGEATFLMDVPDYKIQPRDILSITAKAMTPDGKIMIFCHQGIMPAVNRANRACYLMVMMLIVKVIL